jgi:hypothetical protein
MTLSDTLRVFSHFLASTCLILACEAQTQENLQPTHTLKIDDVTMTNGWVRIPPPGAANAAAFFTLHNNTSTAKQLSSVQCAPAIASACEIHEHIHTNGRMRMQKISDGIAIPGNSDLQFSPGKYHVMLLNVNPALKNAQSVELVFTFSDQSTYHAQLAVKSVNEE